MYWCEADSPVGRLLLAGTPEALTQVHFQAGPRPLQPPPQWRPDAAPFAPALAQLSEYFRGTRHAFGLPLAPAGTSFQLGETVCYGELARRLGLPRGARAVGLANGANPLPIVVPCHRVIGADGSLTGFGGGLVIKRALLSLEGANCVADLFSAHLPGHAQTRAT
jgi:methylated-DNA-[protein]-cysteine S-methyltransferase